LSEELKSYYFKKKILLTGHTGFKGSWLLKILSMWGAEVKGISLAPNANQKLFGQIQGFNLCHHIELDILNQKQLENEIKEFCPEIIFHLAAQSLVRQSYDQPKETYLTNVIGTLNLFEAVKLLNIKCNIIVVTTDKVYENIEQEYLYKESDRLGGYDPYSSSKAACEVLVSSYRNSFFNPEKYTTHFVTIATARAGNVIGGGDWSEGRIFPDMIKAFQNSEPVVIRNPKAVRPFQHVLESLSGYLQLAFIMDVQRLKVSYSYNFGPGISDCIEVQELVKTCVKELGYGSFTIDSSTNHVHEAKLLMLDNSKAKRELGWLPKWNINMAIRYTLEWYMVNDSEKIMKTDQQIKDYFDII
jgi:CDP-glucose 4,6-dehydratase